jgi:hypothetical protein
VPLPVWPPQQLVKAYLPRRWTSPPFVEGGVDRDHLVGDEPLDLGREHALGALRQAADRRGADLFGSVHRSCTGPGRQ